MEVQTENHEMLELVLSPAFCVKADTIVHVNAAARAMLLAPGTPIAPLLYTGSEEYADFSGGCLYLQLCLGGQLLDACVRCIGGEDVFLLEPAAANSQLQALSLAARELREPLNDLMAITGALLPQALPESSGKTDDLLARATRGLYQMQRILGNMSDAGQGCLTHLEARNLRAVFSEILSKSAALLEHSGVALHWQGLEENVLGQIDRQLMERAVLNLLSNAVKFLPPEGGRIDAILTRRGDRLQLCVTDNGTGIPDAVLPGIFTRYQRQGGIEDSRCGLGLGMVVVREAASRHGGTVLVRRLSEGGTQICLTMKVCASAAAKVRCTCTDLTGGQDPALVELSQILPPELYRRKR